MTICVIVNKIISILVKSVIYIYFILFLLLDFFFLQGTMAPREPIR